MMQIPEFNPIAYMMGRKFPLILQNWRAAVVGGSGKVVPLDDRQRERANAYNAKLKAMSAAGSLAKAVRREQAKELAEERAKHRFNQRHAQADFQYWAKQPYWILEEAIALFFGKEPSVVNSKSVESLSAPDRAILSSFLRDYVRLKDLAERAKIMGQIGDLVTPSDFIAWAKRSDIDCPPELETELVAQGKIVDWKAVYDDLKRQHDRLVAERDVLKAQVSSFEAQQAEPQEEKDLGPRERDTYQKMILGMAQSSTFGYDPESAKSPAPSKIARAIDRIGQAVDEKTIRDKLRVAAKALSLMKAPER